jgi:hypothetical protein
LPYKNDAGGMPAADFSFFGQNGRFFGRINMLLWGAAQLLSWAPSNNPFLDQAIDYPANPIFPM